MADIVKLQFVVNNEVPTEVVSSQSPKRRQRVKYCKSTSSAPDNKKKKMTLKSDKSVVPCILHPTESIMYETEIPLDTDALYISLLCQHKVVMPVDANYRAFFMQDFDTSKSSLLNNYVVVKRRIVKTPQGLTPLYGCSCNPARQQMIDNFSISLSTNLLGDFDPPYQKCHHIQAIEYLAKDFYSKTGFSMESEYENETKHDDAIDDHSYDKCKPKIDLYGFDNCSHVICVRLKEFGEDPTYSIVSIDFTGRCPHLNCSTCKESGCIHTKAIFEQDSSTSDISGRLLEVINKRTEWRSKYIPLPVSAQKIPFCLKSEENKQNRSFLSHHIKTDGLISLIPSPDGCCTTCGDNWGLEEPFEDLKIYTEVDILSAKGYIRRCSNTSCLKWKDYDGAEDQLLFMGSYLVSHEVLRNYMRQYVTEGTTLISYYKEWYWKQVDNGNVQFNEEFSYHRFRYAWYSFVQLLDIDYRYGFACPECGDTPETVVMDGVALGIRKSFMPWKDYLNHPYSVEVLDGSSHNTRVFINNQKTRLLLEKYALKGIHLSEFEDLRHGLCQHQPTLSGLFDVFFEDGFTFQCPEIFRGLLHCLSSNYPVCGLIHYHPGLFDVLHKISDGCDVAKNAENIVLIEQQVPVLSRLFRDLKWTVPNYIKPVIRELILKAESPFKSNGSHDLPLCNEACECNGIGYFPTLRKLCHRGDYFLDDRQKPNAADCSKKGSTHPSLMPGIFTLSCVHGICYGFQMMEDVESPNLPFIILRTRFNIAPKLVIYDNACNLHNYCLNRDPVFVRDTWFLVDRFHWCNHKGCHVGYNVSHYNQYVHLNSQVAEQRNSTLKRLKTMLSYMNVDNFKNHLRLFLWFRSMISLSLLHPDLPVKDIQVFRDLSKVYSKLKV